MGVGLEGGGSRLEVQVRREGLLATLWGLGWEGVAQAWRAIEERRDC